MITIIDSWRIFNKSFWIFIFAIVVSEMIWFAGFVVLGLWIGGKFD